MTTTTAPTTGAEIKQCVQFLATIWNETRYLFLDVERALRPLASLQGSEVYFHDLQRNMNNPDAWIQESVGRILGDGGIQGASTDAVMLEVHLAPKGFNHALFVVGHAVFDGPRTKKDIVAKYPDWLITIMGSDGAARAVPTQARGKLFSDAAALHVAAWPLTSLVDAGTVEATVVATVRKWLVK